MSEVVAERPCQEKKGLRTSTVVKRVPDYTLDSIDMYVFVQRTNYGWRIYEWYNNDF